MLSKSQIKKVRSLHLKKNRKANGLFVAEGNINVTDLLESDLKLEHLYATDRWITGHPETAEKYHAEKISAKEMEMMTLLKTPSEVLAVFQLPETSKFNPDEIVDYILMLDNIKDPGNLGTIIRTADWFGIKNIVCSPETVDVFNPKVVQATMGSLARVGVHYIDLPEFLTSVNNLNIYGAFLNGSPVDKVEKTGKGIIVVGSEAHGISREVEKLITHRITIPSFGQKEKGAESLNASIATAILCYEFRRR
jgi:TrmH family RNA methyltransferase